MKKTEQKETKCIISSIYNNLEQMKLAKTISQLLSEICESNTNDQDDEITKTSKIFLSKKIPQITIFQYIERLIKYTRMENSTLVLILIYIDKIINMNGIRINYRNIHKLILSAMITAIKFNEDEYYANDFYCEVGGVSLKEIKRLEYHFFILSNFNLFISDEVFNRYYKSLLQAEKLEEKGFVDDVNKSGTSYTSINTIFSNTSAVNHNKMNSILTDNESIKTMNNSQEIQDNFDSY